MAGRIGRPSWRARRGQDGRERMGGPPGGLGGVGRHSWWNGRGGEGWEASGGPLGGMERIGKYFQRARRSRESLLKGRAVLEGPPRGSGGVRRPIRMARWFGSPLNRAGRSRDSHTGAGRGCEALQEGLEGS